MDETQLAVRSKDVVASLVREAITDRLSVEHPVILTRYLQRQLERVLPDLTDNPFIFLGYDGVTMPIMTFNAPVWFVESPLENAYLCHFGSDIVFVKSPPKILPERRDGVIVMSESIESAYKALRGDNRNSPNGTVRFVEDASLRTSLEQLAASGLKLDFREYLKGLGTRIAKDDSDNLFIRENLYLRGPYPFEIPENLTVDGNLYITELFYQEWPDSLKVTGEVKVISDY